MNFEEWQITVSDEIKNDMLWKMSVYKYALFIGEIGWFDVTKLQGDSRLYKVSNQLYGALGSISANISEGYSRGSNKERAHFYEYALGSARESRDWYYKSRHVLGSHVFQHRLELLTHIIRLLLTMVPQQRGKALHEEPSVYETKKEVLIEELFNTVPMP
ncbi:MAG TPA: four helix bundle protein [Anaerolineales bacterium]|nr:four helix bundle protein [Anaerolineales bacterium]